jgi:hypothetical protein
MIAVPTTDRRFDRASWATLGGVLGFAVVCALVAALILSQPGDGCLLDAGSGTHDVYACVGEWATPLRPGDRVVAVAGVPLGDGRSPRGPADRLEDITQTATVLPYTVERAGQLVDLAVPLGRLDAQGLARAFGAGLLFYSNSWMVYVGIGATIIFILAPRSRAAQILLIAAGCGAVATTLGWTAETVAGYLFAPAPLYDAVIVLDTFWQWLLVPTLLVLVLSFPQHIWPLARWPRATIGVIYAVQVVALTASLLTRWRDFYLAALGLTGLVFLVATISRMVHTFRRVRDPVLRAQTAWLSLGLLAGVVVWPVLFVLDSFFPDAGVVDVQWMNTQRLLHIIPAGIFVLCLGIAITRYRLFDIEVVIRRTAVYGALTAALAAVYLAAVALAQGILRTVTGQESDLAIVAATLVVAALFQPLRRRIQVVIDRRFFRRKYDAARILTAYGAALRDDADIQRVSEKLLGVVGETVQPAHASLWLQELEDKR